MKKFKKFIEEVFILGLSCLCMLSLFLTIYLWTRAITYRNGEKIIMTNEEIQDTCYKVSLNAKVPVIKFKKLVPDAKLPTKADVGSACYDLYAVEDTLVPPHGRVLVKTGLCWNPPVNALIEMQIRPRSGLALKHGITVLNTPGTIDASYRGEIGVILYNTTDTGYLVTKGDRIAQAKIAPVTQFNLMETTEIDRTERGDGGFGHSGK